MQKIDKIVPDTSIIIEGLVSDRISNNELKVKEVVNHEAVLAELEHQANQGKAIGFIGLDEIKKLREISEKNKFVNLYKEIGEELFKRGVNVSNYNLNLFLEDIKNGKKIKISNCRRHYIKMNRSSRSRSNNRRKLNIQNFTFVPPRKPDEVDQKLHDLIVEYMNNTSEWQQLQFSILGHPFNITTLEDFLVKNYNSNPYTQSLHSAPRTTSPWVRGEIPFVNQ